MRFIIFFLPVIAAWTPTSWRNKIAVQQPVYQNKQKLEEVENKLRNSELWGVSPGGEIEIELDYATAKKNLEYYRELTTKYILEKITNKS
jgi:hypothetical protein